MPVRSKSRHCSSFALSHCRGATKEKWYGAGGAIAVTFVLSGRLIIDHVREALEHPLAVGSLLEALFSMADDADNKSGRY